MKNRNIKNKKRKIRGLISWKIEFWILCLFGPVCVAGVFIMIILMGIDFIPVSIGIIIVCVLGTIAVTCLLRSCFIRIEKMSSTELNNE